MRIRNYAVLLFAAMMAPPLLAQAPNAEIYGGYSYSNGDPEFSLDRLNLHGWNASLAGNVTRRLGVVADFSGHYGSPVVAVPVFCPAVVGFPCPPQQAQLKANNHTFLFGPRLSLRRTKVTPFVHVLFGGERLSVRLNTSSASDTRTGFAMAFGGGMDYSLVRRIAWRVQGDYLPTHQFSYTQNNLRLSTGIVLNFGK